MVSPSVLQGSGAIPKRARDNRERERERERPIATGVYNPLSIDLLRLHVLFVSHFVEDSNMKTDKTLESFEAADVIITISVSHTASHYRAIDPIHRSTNQSISETINLIHIMRSSSHSRLFFEIVPTI